MRKNTLWVVCAILLLWRTAADVGDRCTRDSNCDGIEVCSNAGRCEDPSLFDAFGGGMIAATLLVVIGAALAAGGGLGGGGIFVPIFILIVGMSVTQAVPLSQATIFGGSIVNMVYNVPQKKEGRHGTYPLIDSNAILMFTPLLLAGTVFGVMLNTIFPSWLIVVLLAVTLVSATIRTVKKGIRTWKAETREREEIQLESMQNSDLDPSVVTEESSQTGASTQPISPELLQLLEKDQKPYIQIASIAAVWVVVFLSAYGRKETGTCSTGYWLLLFLTFIALVVLTAVLGRWLFKANEEKTKLLWQPVQGEIMWTRRNAFIYPLFSIIAGILGGLLGIGGGMILGPLLLELGMDSRSVSATSATAVFLTASSAAIQFAIMDQLIVSYALWFGCLGILATWFGQVGIVYLIKKYNRKSFIILCIASVICLATILLIISGIINVIDDAKNDNLGFNPLC